MNELSGHVPRHDFFIAVDSDGCAFDTMEIKHKECFIPNTIRYWGLQAVSRYAREAAEFVNLYSKSRGINRFVALVEVFDLLKERDRVVERGASIPAVPNLRGWIEAESTLSNPVLEAYCSSHDEKDLRKTLEWSHAVNTAIDEMVHGVPPFPHVGESLEDASRRADLLVCSATPHEALTREWREHGLDEFVFSIAGQEQGKKSEHIALAAGGKYAPERMLMIGDAPGDMNAAKANGALFYPINPGAEAESWERFYEEGLEKFFEGTFAGAYEKGLIEEFDRYLPSDPPWRR